MVLQDLLRTVFQDEVCDKTKLRKVFDLGLYKRTLRWLSGETIKVYRFSSILDKCFGNGTVVVASKDYKQIVEFDKTDIKPYEMLYLDQESIYKRWDRMLAADGVPPKSASTRLELAVFLTSVLAADLSTSGESQFRALIRLYYTAFDIIGITCDDNLLQRLCPGNFVKAKEDWSKALAGKEYQSTVLPYDLLCLTVYLALWWLRTPMADEEAKQNIAKIWRTNLHFCSMEPEFENTSLHFSSALQAVREELYPSNDEHRLDVVSTDELSSNNDLFRDPRFLRQANLYYNVDMQAIFEVLNAFNRSGLSILDLGCGDGEVTCSRFGGIAAVSKIICIDSDPQQVETATARIKRDPNKGKFSVYQVDLRDDDLVPQLRKILKENGVEKVDIVFSALTFHYLPQPEIVLAHIKTVLADDGFVILRELDDDTKIYYSQGDIKSTWMDRAVSSYQKVSKYSDRNCARKMHSWLALQGYSDIRLFYDQIDTCGKTKQERKDIFYIMVGFRKARAEKMLREKADNVETEKYLNDVIQSCDELESLFAERDFWFFFTNYVAIARNSKCESKERTRRTAVELFLIRHAHCDVSESEIGVSVSVSGTGRKEIDALTTRLSSIDFDEIVCSTVERAVLTALPIANSHKLSLIEYPELAEIDRGDVLTDQMWAENDQYYRRWKKHETDLPFPNGENGMDVWLRGKFVIDRICEAAAEKAPTDGPYRACVVTHGGTIRALICGLLGISERMRYQFAANLHPCSISVIRIAGDPSENANTDFPATLELFNDDSHLRGTK